MTRGTGARNALIMVSLGIALCSVRTTQAEDPNAILDLLERKGLITSEEAAQARKYYEKQQAEAVAKYDKTQMGSWIDQMKWSSDFRLRYEYLDNADQANKNDRTRFRYRLRLGFETKLKEWAKIGVRIASGGEDPTSTNQSFQDTFSRKEFRLDLGYVTLTPPEWNWFSMSGGKINNPIWQPGFNSPMQYDFDITPEGLGEQIAYSVGSEKRVKLIGNFGQFVLDEVGGDANDPWMVEFQGGAEVNLGKDPKKPVVKVTALGGYSRTFNLQNMGVSSGSQPAGAATPGSQSTSANRGNATRQPGGAGTTLFYLDDFQVVYGRGVVAWTISENPFLGTPSVLAFSGEYIHNLSDKYDNLKGSNITKSPGQTDGWTGQVAFGGSKKKGEWQVLYQYKHLEADATWDSPTDSDFGLGGTDREGHIMKATYNIRDWWQLGFTGLITEKISSRPNSGQETRGKAGSDLLRVQADTVFKF